MQKMKDSPWEASGIYPGTNDLALTSTGTLPSDIPYGGIKEPMNIKLKVY